MNEFVEHNRRAWDEIHRRRHASHGDALGADDTLLDRLEPLQGKRVLHLQCATGETSRRLAERGAEVTGVDVAEEALAVARELTPSATFVRADVHALPTELTGFDVVVTEGGVLVWLHDLDAWAAGVARALRPGGTFLLADEHPVSMCVDGDLRWAEDYFDESVYTETGWEHFELSGPPATEIKHERFWRLGAVVTAVAASGLRIERLEEHPGSWRGTDRRVPGSFVLVARRA